MNCHCRQRKKKYVGDDYIVLLGSKEKGVEESRAKRSGCVIGVKRH